MLDRFTEPEPENRACHGRKLRSFLDQRRKPSASFERASGVDREAVGEELERHGIGVPLVEIEGCFPPTGRSLRVDILGPVHVERSLLREEACCPLEVRAGIVEGRRTPRAARQALWFVANLMPGEVEELLDGAMVPMKAGGRPGIKSLVARA